MEKDSVSNFIVKGEMACFGSASACISEILCPNFVVLFSNLQINDHFRVYTQVIYFKSTLCLDRFAFQQIAALK